MPQTSNSPFANTRNTRQSTKKHFTSNTAKMCLTSASSEPTCSGFFYGTLVCPSPAPAGLPIHLKPTTTTNLHPTDGTGDLFPRNPLHRIPLPPHPRKLHIHPRPSPGLLAPQGLRRRLSRHHSPARPFSFGRVCYRSHCPGC